MNSTDFEFIPPPEAPVFEPTAEEFKDPLAYIAKIRPIAEQTGICKIKPPPEWQPPFAVDVDNFRFTPRMQRLNELEATTRVKLNFLDQIAKFWELQGSSLKIPNVERKALDLFTLYRVVLEEGGSEVVSRERRWARIATRMGYPPGRGVGTLLRQHYERILYPYHVFQEGTSIGELTNLQDGDSEDSEDKDYVPHGIPSRQAIRPPEDRYARRSKRRKDDPDDIDYSTNNELKKLQFYGAGPKMPGFHGQGGTGNEEECKAEEAMLKENHIECFKDLKMGLGAKDLQMGFGTKLSGSFLKETRSVGVAAKLGFLLKRKDRPRGKMPIDQIVCTICNRGDEEASMLLCDGCDDSYHTFCLIPPLPEIPKGDWRCPCCVAKEVNKPQEAFGFEQAQREYTLQEFGQKADEFKTNYFNMPVHRVPFSMVEKEFWRIVNAVDEDVTVEYGADLHTIEHGSGFPNSKTKSLMPGDEDYIQSGWNLNNLPVLEGSVLKHIQADISGMKIPWTYVGMCFATFCWHNEDHWSYSINYLHWGEPKTWYGVPGGKAEAFEEAMRSVAPELFSTQPDLLHQLVTIMNPNLLISQGVPICRTNQQAGEFVVTFPRSYHAGFNQGYNFAEAVNFAPADWLPIGRVCVAHYGMLHRFCVFSHDELVCKMASDPERLDVSIAASTYQDMLRMVEDERELRKSLKDWGVTQASREVFELVPDDERQCDYCKTTCFLSAVTCPCTNSNKVTCIHHKDKLCSCPPDKHCLLYRYTLDELPSMLHRLKVRAESFDNWSARVEEALSASGNSKLSLCELKELSQQAEEKHFPHSNLLQSLAAVVEEAEKCTALAQQLLSRRVRTRTRQSGETKSPARLTLEDLLLFHQQLSTLACEIKESFLVKDLLDRAIAFQTEAREILKDVQADSKKLEKCLEVGINLDIEFPEIPQLKQKVQQSRWVEEVGASLGCGEVSLESLRRLLERGASIAPHPSVERVLAELQDLLTFGETWEEKAKACLVARPKLAVHALESILQKAGTIDVHMPNVLQLKDAVCKAKDWLSKVQLIQKGPHNPYLDAAEWLVGRGRGIPVRLEPLPALEQQVEAARAWRDKTARTFLKKNSPHSLLEVLSPRKDIGAPLPTKKTKKRKEPDNDLDDSFPGDMKLEETKDPAAIVSLFKEAEKAEVEAMVGLRARNERRLVEGEDGRCCVCGKPSAPPSMLCCDLCKDCCHMGCVPSAGRRQEGRFLCPLCVRSRRPRLETILSLLLALQKLPLRLPEGEALQCLTERAMNWQDRAKQLLKTEEVCGALASLSAEHLLKAEDNKWVPPNDVVASGIVQEGNMDTSENDSSANYSMEHAYSTASKTGTGVGATGVVGSAVPRKHARKSPLVARQTHPPVLQLGEGMRLRLERLAVEGELLEMTLDESQDLWRLLRATSLSKDSADMQEVDHSSIQVEKKKPKKQKLDHSGKSGIMKKFSKGKVSKGEGKSKKIKSFRFKKEMRDGTVKTVKMKAFERKKKKAEPDEVCSAASCLRPFGGAVNWVQCDGGCEQWFHLLCVGLDVSQVSENEDYICPNCRRDSVTAASVLASFSAQS